MLTRLARWWLNRRTRPSPVSEPALYVPWGECAAVGCGVELHGDDIHVLVRMSEDDELLGIEGQTAVSADYCGEHCPGGCQHGCATITT